MSEEKKYGESVINYDFGTNATLVITDSLFESEYDSLNDIDQNERESLRNGYRKEKISEKTTTDAISGIRSSMPIDDIISDEDSIVPAIKGIRISHRGVSLLNAMMLDEDEYLSDLESRDIAIKFDEYEDELKKSKFNSLDDNILYDFLPKRFMERIDEIYTMNQNKDIKKRDIISRLLEEIYNGYISTIQYKDDVKELMNLARRCREMGIGSNNVDPLESMKSIDELNELLAEYAESMKKLDERNKGLRQNYTISDIDSIYVKEIHDSLSRSLRFERVRDKIANSKNKLKKDLKNKDKCNKSIIKWIDDLKQDPYTIFTFPCNDTLDSVDSMNEVLNFLLNGLLMHHVVENNIEIPEIMTDDLATYLISNQYVNLEKMDIYRAKVYVFLYVLSRTFKSQKIRRSNLELNDPWPRELCYCLEIISKLGIPSHRERLWDICEYIYQELQ